ncbi:hypothetical protein GCM10010378_46010 [Streptomyces viridochromogenes]
MARNNTGPLSGPGRVKRLVGEREIVIEQAAQTCGSTTRLVQPDQDRTRSGGAHQRLKQRPDFCRHFAAAAEEFGGEAVTHDAAGAACTTFGFSARTAG